jgi:hypothetical protein
MDLLYLSFRDPVPFSYLPNLHNFTMSFESVASIITFIAAIVGTAAATTMLVATYHSKGRIGKIVFAPKSFASGTQEIRALLDIRGDTVLTKRAVEQTTIDIALIKTTGEQTAADMALTRAASEQTSTDMALTRAAVEQMLADMALTREAAQMMEATGERTEKLVADIALSFRQIARAVGEVGDRRPGPFRQRRRRRRNALPGARA